MKQVYKEGFAAFWASRSFASNPYGNGTVRDAAKRRAWEKGWSAAFEETLVKREDPLGLRKEAMQDAEDWLENWKT